MKWLLCVLLDHRYELRHERLGATTRGMRAVYVCARCGDRS